MNTFLRPSLITAAALCALPVTALHAQSGDSYYYWGAGVGQSRLRIDDRRISETLAARNLTTTAIGHDERHVGYKVFLGYQINRYFGIEIGFFDLGKFGYTATTTPAGTLDSSFRVQGGNIGIIGTMPLMNWLPKTWALLSHCSQTKPSPGAGPCKTPPLGGVALFMLTRCRRPRPSSSSSSSQPS